MELENIIRLPHFATMPQYYRMGKLNKNAANIRVKSGIVAYIKIDGVVMIDTQLSPAENVYRKRKGVEVPKVVLPKQVDIKALKHVCRYANKKSRRAHNYLVPILSGKIFGLVLGSEVFAYKADLDKL